MPAAGQLRNGSPPTSPTPPNNLAPHDSLFLGSAGRWPVAFGSLPNALIAAHNSVQNTSQGFAASCRELQASGLRSPETSCREVLGYLEASAKSAAIHFAAAQPPASRSRGIRACQRGQIPRRFLRAASTRFISAG